MFGLSFITTLNIYNDYFKGRQRLRKCEAKFCLCKLWPETVRLPVYGTLFLFALHLPPSSPNHKTQGTSFPFTLLLSTPKPTAVQNSSILFSLCHRHGTHVRQLPPSPSLTTNPASCDHLSDEATAQSSTTPSPLKLSPNIHHRSSAPQGWSAVG